MTGQPDDFDLDAALLRRSQGDLRAFMEALAVRLETALPGHVAVERRRDGLLSKTSHVSHIRVAGQKATYSLSLIHGLLDASRAKIVHGVVISTSAIEPAEWLAEVRAEAKALAAQAGAGADVLQDFL